MSASYNPDRNARPFPPWSIATLSERDLSLRVPINFVTAPGVNLRQACFGNNLFDSQAAVRCFSNLLAAGYRRFTWDIYWDEFRRVHSFCPIRMPQSDIDGVTSATTQMLFGSSELTVSDAVITGRAIAQAYLRDHNEVHTTRSEHTKRQESGTAVSSAADEDVEPVTSLVLTLGGSETTSTNIAPESTPTTSSPNDLINLGSYSCSPSIDLPILAAVLDGYFEQSSNTLEAFLVYIRLNLHVAAVSGTTPARALNSSSLPGSQEYVSSLLAANLSSYLYTPAALQSERANVNDTWYKAISIAQPLPGYFNLTDEGSHSSSQDGWPNEIYLEFETQRRLLTEFGTIDPELAGYDFTEDLKTIFPAGSLGSDQASDIELNVTGQVIQGCRYDPAALTVGGNNNSWASYSFDEFPAERGTNFNTNGVPQVGNLTSCGISSFLNTTIFDRTADQDISLYDDFLRSANWAWQYGEPRNVSSDEENDNRIRCAAMDSSLNGRWRVVDCTERHYSACRQDNDPYNWHISFSKATYTGSNDVCDSNQAFGVPLTPLENAHLHRRMNTELGDGDNLVWLNFNSLDVSSCWVAGVNNTCPYRDRTLDDDSRKIIVPTVAAVIVFVVTALTMFVKCAANRQTSKRRRRRKGETDFPYEGIPQ